MSSRGATTRLPCVSDFEAVGQAVVVLSTVPDARTARKLAGLLVKEKLAACVSIQDRLVSQYRWKGKVETVRESLLLIKTSRSRYPEIQKFILKNHPYEIPELLALPVVEASKKYLKWLASSLK